MRKTQGLTRAEPLTNSTLPTFQPHTKSQFMVGLEKFRELQHRDTWYTLSSSSYTGAPVSVDICSSVAVDLCLNGGTCLSRGDSYSCQCPDGWTGAQCDQSKPVSPPPLPPSNFGISSLLSHSKGNQFLSAPVLVRSPQTTFAQLFTEVVLECNVEGNPEPIVTWFRDGLEIVGATQERLVIEEMDLSDRARYHCTAKNSQGSVTSDKAYLNIQGGYIYTPHLFGRFSVFVPLSGLAQYAVSVQSLESNLASVDKWVYTHTQKICHHALSLSLCLFIAHSLM